MADLVDIKGNPIDEAPHLSDVPELLRQVAARADPGGDLESAEHVLVIIMLKDGARYIAAEHAQTLAQTLFMLKCEEHDLLTRATSGD